MELLRKVALITGGAQGIGLDFVQQLLKNQVKVCFCDILEKQGKESEKVLQEKYGKENVIFQKCDVTNSEQLEECFKYTKDHFGKLDIVINNAAIVNEDEDTWKKMIDLNFKAVVEGTTLGFKYMNKQFGGNGGTIINTSSYIALVPHNTILPGALYTSIKKAVIYYTTTLGMKSAYDLTGIRTLAICPGFTNTTLVDNFSDKPPTPYFAKNTVPGLHDLLKGWTGEKMSPECVAQGMIYALKNAESGTVWTFKTEREGPIQVKFTIQGIDDSILVESLKDAWIANNTK